MSGADPTLSSFVADDGETIRVQVSGSGRPIVLLHEWAADHRVWRPFIGELAARGFAVYAWDARGHGESSSRAPATVERMACDLANMFDHFHLDKPVVVGHSMGALTLWQYIAVTGCCRLSAICIIDQTPKLVTGGDWELGIYGDFPDERNRRFLAALSTDFPAAVLALMADGHNERTRRLIAANSEGIIRLRHRLEHLDPTPLRDCWTSLAAADFRSVLPTITIPTLLIYADQSTYYGPAVAHYVHATIPGSILHLYVDADHSPHQGHRKRFLDDLQVFLRAT